MTLTHSDTRTLTQIMTEKKHFRCVEYKNCRIKLFTVLYMVVHDFSFLSIMQPNKDVFLENPTAQLNMN